MEESKTIKNNNNKEEKMSTRKRIISLLVLCTVLCALAINFTPQFAAFAAIIIMIVLHEWGHFIAGRICKTPIHEFSIGMGPLLFQKQGRKETKFSIRLIPMGGYCAFDADDASGDMDSSLYALSIPKRIFIYVMGPFMNFVTAFLVFFSIAFFIGFPNVHTTVQDVAENTPAYGVLEVGDTILSVDGNEINDNPTLLSEYLSINPDEPKELTVSRNGENITLSITPKLDETSKKYIVGITQSVTYDRISLGKSIIYGFTETGESIKSVFSSLAGLITGKYKVSDMSGIVGIVSIMGEYATTQTIAQFLILAGLISANLGIMNLIPFPGLDGSKVLLSIYEAITKKRFPEKAEYYITLVGMALIFLLTIVVTYFDISRLK